MPYARRKYYKPRRYRSKYNRTRRYAKAGRFASKSLRSRLAYKSNSAVKAIKYFKSILARNANGGNGNGNGNN